MRPINPLHLSIKRLPVDEERHVFTVKYNKYDGTKLVKQQKSCFSQLTQLICYKDGQRWAPALCKSINVMHNYLVFVIRHRFISNYCSWYYYIKRLNFVELVICKTNGIVITLWLNITNSGNDFDIISFHLYVPT